MGSEKYSDRIVVTGIAVEDNFVFHIFYAIQL